MPALQWTTDPVRMIERMVDAVRPGGVLALATFGPDNVRETAELTEHTLRYRTLPSLVEQISRRGRAVPG